MSRNWVAVASAEHVRLARSKGSCRSVTARTAPLRRVQPGDGVVYYSPTSVFRGSDRLQSFTAIGVARDGALYQAEMEGFAPFRRDVDWQAARKCPSSRCRPAAIHDGETELGLSVALRPVEISAPDMAVIAEAMGVALSPA